MADLKELDDLLASLQKPTLPPREVTARSAPETPVINRQQHNQLPDFRSAPTPSFSAQSSSPVPSAATATAASSSSTTTPSSHNNDELSSILLGLQSNFDDLGLSTPNRTCADDFRVVSSLRCTPSELEVALRNIVNSSVESSNRGAMKDGSAFLVSYVNLSSGEKLCTLAVQAVTNLALDAACREEMGKSGAIEELVKVVGATKTTDLLDRSLSAIANLCVHNDKNRKRVTESNLAMLLPPLLESPSFEVVQRALTCVINCTFYPGAQKKLVSAGIVEKLALLLPVPTTCNQAVWAIAILSAGDESIQQALTTTKVIGGVAQLLGSTDLDTQTKALTSVVNLSANERAAQQWVNAGVVGPLLDFATNGKSDNTKVLSLKALQNISLSDAGVNAMITKGCTSTLLSVLTKGTTQQVSIAVCVLINVSANPAARKMLVEAGVKDVVQKLTRSDDLATSENAQVALNNLNIAV